MRLNIYYGTVFSTRSFLHIRVIREVLTRILRTEECVSLGEFGELPNLLCLRVCSSHLQWSVFPPSRREMSVDFNTAESKNILKNRGNKRTSVTITIKKNCNPGWTKEWFQNIKAPVVLSGPAAYNVCEECGTSSVWTLQLLYPNRLIEPWIIGM